MSKKTQSSKSSTESSGSRAKSASKTAHSSTPTAASVEPEKVDRGQWQPNSSAPILFKWQLIDLTAPKQGFNVRVYSRDDSPGLNPASEGIETIYMDKDVTGANDSVSMRVQAPAFGKKIKARIERKLLFSDQGIPTTSQLWLNLEYQDADTQFSVDNLMIAENPFTDPNNVTPIDVSWTPDQPANLEIQMSADPQSPDWLVIIRANDLQSAEISNTRVFIDQWSLFFSEAITAADSPGSFSIDGQNGKPIYSGLIDYKACPSNDNPTDISLLVRKLVYPGGRVQEHTLYSSKQD